MVLFLMSVLSRYIFSPAICGNEASIVSFFLLSSRLRRGQMKEASEMKYGDQVEGVCTYKAVCVYLCACLLLIICSLPMKLTLVILITINYR